MTRTPRRLIGALAALALAFAAASTALAQTAERRRSADVAIGRDNGIHARTGLFGQMGLRWVSGMTEIDDLASTGLETISDKSSRWTLPSVAGLRVRF